MTEKKSLMKYSLVFSVLLFSTDPVVCADLAYPMDGSYTEQAVENILSDLDAQALWLYPADAKGA